jgi:hypothetical protein
MPITKALREYVTYSYKIAQPIGSTVGLAACWLRFLLNQKKLFLQYNPGSRLLVSCCIKLD